METIADNGYYTIKVDKAKNRIYNIFRGYWKSSSVVPHYMDDGKKALQKISEGFTCLVDVTIMKTPPDDVSDLHIKMQSLFVKAGLKKTAEVFSSSVMKLLTNRLAKESGMFKQIFDNWEDAEKWLDEK